jgi:hypothetical protein
MQGIEMGTCGGGIIWGIASGTEATGKARGAATCGTASKGRGGVAGIDDGGEMEKLMDDE